MATLELLVGIKDLLHAVARTGGLATPQFNNIHTAAAGTRLHAAFAKAYKRYFPRAEARPEQPLQLPVTLEDFRLTIRGRADLRLYSKTQAPLLTDSTEGILEPAYDVTLEIKTTGLPLEELSEQGERLHWLQCAFYAAAAARELKAPPTSTITYGLVYISSESLETRFLYRQEPLADLLHKFENLAFLYLAEARQKAGYLERSRASCRRLPFPYDSLRLGQKELMEKILVALSQKEILFCEAPTGIGKTVATLYPAVKALGHGRLDRIFYLTAKTAVRDQALAAVSLMREKGLELRTTLLTARERICFCPDICCETALCPYATDYYDRLPKALKNLLPLQLFDRPAIEQAARKFELCPFELGLDLARLSDLVIGDYNHVFDPRSRLSIVPDPDLKQAFLVDEAHNFPDRSINMFSAVLAQETVVKAREGLAKLAPDLTLITAPVLAYFNRLEEACQDEEDEGFPQLEPKNKDSQVLKSKDFLGLRCRAEALCRRLHLANRKLRPILDEVEDISIKKDLKDFYFAAHFFVKVCDEYWNEDYVLMFERTEEGYCLSQRCQSAAANLKRQRLPLQAHIFFSATLTPLSYYSTSICGPDPDPAPDSLALPSPFPPEHLNLIIAPLKTVYRERRQTAPALAALLALTIKRRPVNQLIYFPSYAYLNLVLPYFKEALGDFSGLLQIQEKGGDDRSSQAFIAAFQNKKHQQVVGLAVLGGIFGEGIDLEGKQLGGVICIGTGLPQITPQAEILKEYYNEQYEDGELYAYVYPGFNKVLQAAGRLIRNEEDTGFILLVDERFCSYQYQELFPSWWNPHLAEGRDHLCELLDETFEPEGPTE